MKKIVLVSVLTLAGMMSSSLYAQTSYTKGIANIQTTLAAMNTCVESAASQVAQKAQVSGVAAVLAIATPLSVSPSCDKLVTITVDSETGNLNVATTASTSAAMSILNGQAWVAKLMFDNISTSTLLTTKTYIVTGISSTYTPPANGTNLTSVSISGTNTNLLTGLSALSG